VVKKFYRRITDALAAILPSNLEGGNLAMLRWTLTFLLIALVAAVLGFGGIAASAAAIAKVLFFVFLIFFVISLFAGITRKA
jgi:uncharacterized membrane protein YtjA (UPF0391 family)